MSTLIGAEPVAERSEALSERRQVPGSGTLRVVLGEPAESPTPDLAPPSGELIPRFPVDEGGTALVLFDSAPGELRVHWCLERDVFERVGAVFPPGGARPWAVIRLRRDRPEGGSESVAENPLGSGTREGRGDICFRIAPDHYRYRAELGLTDGGDGWLMLARSNGLYNAVGIAVSLARLAELPGGVRDRGAGPDRPTVHGSATSPEAPVAATDPTAVRARESDAGGGWALSALDREPALVAVALDGIPSAFPLDLPPSRDGPQAPAQIAGPPEISNRSGWSDRGLVSDLAPSDGVRTKSVPGSDVPICASPGPAFGLLAAPEGWRLIVQGQILADLVQAPILGQFPIASPMQSGLRNERRLSGSGFASDLESEGFQSGFALHLQSVSTGEGIREVPPVVTVQGQRSGDSGKATAVRLGASIAAPTYETPPDWRPVAEIEVELRIHGRAAPGSLVDLFGHPFRVGPGGRFMLRVKVEDAGLVGRALDLAPPPELTLKREG